MDEAQFWSLIESAKERSNGDTLRQVEIIREIISALKPEQIVSFHDIFERLDIVSCSGDLWAAAYIMNGGCSDDGFMDFRAWLIAQGREVFYAAIRDPDSLADVRVDFEAAECEAMRYVALEAYSDRTGVEMTLPMKEAAPNLEFDWTEDTVMSKYPRLAARFAAYYLDPED